MRSISFSADTKTEDGSMLSGSVRMWVSCEKARRAQESVRRIMSCIADVRMPTEAASKLMTFFGECERSLDPIPQTREAFDCAMSEFLGAIGLPLPGPLRKIIIGIRHALPTLITANLPAEIVRVVCLFPISPAVDSQVMGRNYNFDSGFCADGLFLWLGQQQRQGHVEVVDALENCCASYQAVLVFTRTCQTGKHCYVGRARGYFPICNQDSSLRQAARLGLLLDTSSPFCIGGAVLWPGQLSQKPTKASVHQYLGLSPPKRYDKCGYSVSYRSGECSLIMSPMATLTYGNGTYR